MFHVKCKVRNSKKAFVSVFIYRTRDLQMTEAFAIRKTDDKNTENKTWGCFRATKAYKVVGGTAPDGRCFSMVLDLKNKKRTHTKKTYARMIE